MGGLYFTEGKENSTNKTIQNYTSHNWIREATGPTGKFDYALNSKDQSQTWVPSLELKTRIFISPVESALSKLCVALHGSVCLNRHSWHIRLATLSKSHLHRFICDDLRTHLFPNAPCPKTYFTSVIEKASPKTTSSASNTCCDKIKQKRKKKKGHSFCNRLTPSYINTGRYIPHTLTVHIHAFMHTSFCEVTHI